MNKQASDIPIGEPVVVSFIDPISQQEYLPYKYKTGKLKAKIPKWNIYTVSFPAHVMGESPEEINLGRENIAKITK